MNDTTLTLVVSNHPRDLLKYLRNDSRFKVESPFEGIRYVVGERVAVQIIETKSLSDDDNLWLKSLRRKLDLETLTRLLGDSERYGNEAGAYLYAVAKANKDTLKGVDLMENFAEVFMESPDLMNAFKKLGWVRINEAEAEIRSEANLETVKRISETAKRMLEDGTPYEKIASWLLIPVEEVAAIDKSGRTK